MLRDDQPGEERAQVAAAACGVDREVARGDDHEHGDRSADSRQIPSRRVEMASARTTPKADAQARSRCRDRSGSRRTGAASEPSPSITNAANASASTAPVTSLSADSAMIVCATFGSDPHALEERDQDRRIGRREGGADEEARLDRDVEGDAATATGDDAVIITPGIASSPSPIATGLRTSSREPEAAVEEDHRDAEGQEDLDRRSSRAAGRAASGTSGPSSAPAASEHDHARDAEEAGDELGDEPGRQA